MEWTKHVLACRHCGRRFRVSRETIDIAISEGCGPDRAHVVDYCLGCMTGQEVEGEIVDNGKEDMD